MAFTVTIEGVDRTASVVFGSLKKNDNLNQQVDNLEFIIRKYGALNYVPSLNDEAVVVNNGVSVFGGVVVKIEESLRSNKIIEYRVICNDYSQYLKRKLVTERYENQTVAAIISDILTNYAADFTDTNVVTGPTIESISFNRLSVADSLQKLADAIGYVWYVDYDKDIHFFPKNEELAPFNLTDSSNNYIYGSLEIVEDLTQVRNSVLVQGGEAESTITRTETITADGTNDQYKLVNKFSQTPTVEVNNVAQTVGVEYIDDDALFDCMWNYNEKYIRFTSGNVPTAGQTIEIIGYYLYPIVVRVPSNASISQYGTYEFAISDKSIRSQQEAIDRAFAELKSYQNEVYEGSFRTYNDGLRSGQVINISSVQRSKDIDVLIQSVSMRMRDPEGLYFEYEVRFATLKSIGIIEYLQNQLRSKEVIVDDQETLLNLIDFTDSAGLSDSIAAPVTQQGPYRYGGNFDLDQYSATANATPELNDSTKYHGQSFSTGTHSVVLQAVTVNLSKDGSPTGNLTAKIYAHTGTFGSTGKPTGAALATSDTLDVSTLSTSPTSKTLTFSGANKITLSASTKYVAVIYYQDGTVSDLVYIDASTAAGHSGNPSSSADGTTWGTSAGYDFIFSVTVYPTNVGRYNFATWS